MNINYVITRDTGVAEQHRHERRAQRSYGAYACPV